MFLQKFYKEWYIFGNILEQVVKGVINPWPGGKSEGLSRHIWKPNDLPNVNDVIPSMMISW